MPEESIMMCHGVGCDIKQWCYRHKAKPTKNQQYFKHSPMRTWWAEGLLWGKVYACPESWTRSSDMSALRRWSTQMKTKEARKRSELKKSGIVVRGRYFNDRASYAHFCANEGHCGRALEPETQFVDKVINQ